MSYQTRFFIPSDEAYRAITELRNLDCPDDLLTSESRKYDDTMLPEGVFAQRLLVEQNGQPVLEGIYGEMHWSPKPGKFYFNYSIHPDHLGAAVQEAFYNTMLADLQKRNSTIKELVAYSIEDKKERIKFFESKGFALTMRYPLSELALDSFDAAPFATLPAKVAAAGFEIMSIAQLEKCDPDWQRRGWVTLNEIRADLPSADPMEPKPFEEYLKYFKHPMLLEDAFLFAILTNQSHDPANWRYAGLTTLWKSGDPQKLTTGLTGVRREFRRRGVATALKLHAIEYAKGYGAARIDTDNEENNPMFQINLKLGFKPKPAYVDYVKKFD